MTRTDPPSERCCWTPRPKATVAEIAAKMTPDRVAAADAANLYANGHDLKDPVPSPTCGDCMARNKSI
jgi:hypothetical protein